MIVVFIGPPYSGKSTQAEYLAIKLGVPFFSMGKIIREAYRHGDVRAIEGFENYTMKGLHVPIKLKFDLLQERMEMTQKGFVLDNFPATEEDLTTFNHYLEKKAMKIDKVFYINLSEEKMIERMAERGRLDDRPEIIRIRREVQDKDRIPVLNYFAEKGILEEIAGDGNKTIEDIHKEILSKLTTI